MVWLRAKGPRGQAAASTYENFWCDPGPGAAPERAPGIGAAHMTEHIPTRHQPMIILVILSNQLMSGTQQSAASGEGAALD